MIRDARDVAHSTTSDLALRHYETALEQFQSYRGDALATLEAALAADPSFVSAQLFKAFVLYTLSEKKCLPDVVAALAAARAQAPTMTPRERLLLTAGDQLVRYEWDDACRTFDAVLADRWSGAMRISFRRACTTSSRWARCSTRSASTATRRTRSSTRRDARWA